MELKIKDKDGNCYDVSSMEQGNDCLVLVVKKKEKKNNKFWHNADEYMEIIG